MENLPCCRSCWVDWMLRLWSLESYGWVSWLISPFLVPKIHVASHPISLPKRLPDVAVKMLNMLSPEIWQSYPIKHPSSVVPVMLGFILRESGISPDLIDIQNGQVMQVPGLVNIQLKRTGSHFFSRNSRFTMVYHGLPKKIAWWIFPIFSSSLC